MNNFIQFTNRPCPICKHTVGSDHEDARDNGWELKVCEKCNFVYLSNPPAYDAFFEKFAWEKTSEAEKKRRSFEEPILSHLSQLAKFFRHKIFKRNKMSSLIKRFLRSGRILDVGCGSGHMMAFAIKEKYEPWGVEISKALAEKANALFSRYGGCCIQNDAINGMSSMPKEFFDGVTMLSYLEHEIHPREACESAYRCLKQGGYLIAKMPNHASWNRRQRGEKWCGYRFPDHVNYFTPASLSKLLTDTGFSIVQFGWLDRLPISDNMWVVAQKHKALSTN